MTAQIDIHLSERPGWRENCREAKLTTEGPGRFLGDEKGIEVIRPGGRRDAEAAARRARQQDELVEQIFNYCHGDIGPGGDNAPQDAAAVLAKGVASPLGPRPGMVALCRAAKIPARLVTGFEIKLGDDVRPHIWVEVLSDDRWEPYDPENGYSGELPAQFRPRPPRQASR